MELNEILLIVSSAVAVAGLIYSFIETITKGSKTKRIKLAKILQTLPTYIKEAEAVFGAKTGVAKLAYVLNKINIDCLKADIDFDEDQWKVEIEDILGTPQKKNITED